MSFNKAGFRKTLRKTRRGSAGFTLIEMMISVTLVSAIIAGLLIAMRTGLTAYQKTTQRLEDNRRVMGIDQALHRQLGGMMPVTSDCGIQNGPRIPVFTGTEQWLRFVSSSSLSEGSRGYPRIIEYLAMPDPQGGVRLMMSERLYTGPASLAPLCANQTFLPVQLTPQSLQMAGRLAYLRFVYRVPALDSPMGAEWIPLWQMRPDLPRAVRIEMTPLNADVAHLPMVTVNAPVHITRLALYTYVDQ